MAHPGNAADQGESSPYEYELVTGEAVALDVRPASFILRAAGAIIDWLAYLGFFVGLAFAVDFVMGDALDPALAQTLAISGLAFSILVLPTVVETVTGGRSLGKLAIGARIVRDDGGSIQLRHAFTRALSGIFEIYLTFGGLAATTALLNGKSKRLGDLMAGTYSQYERVARFDEPVLGLPQELTTWSYTVDVVRLPDRLSRRIAQFLRQSGRLTPETRVRVASDLAAEAAPFVSPVPAVSPEEFLAGVAAVRRSREYAALLLERERLERLRPVLTRLPHDFPNR
ncbi:MULTISPECIES: RDD family protein [Cryobacterium]|uniref:RDD family protein n=1 Tax=Cryobacterium glucosi TaxID=1259175 RepID=A0ABY2IJT6_9MICO|nr:MULTISPECIES: RDD family protein [Cryobacterium]TFB97113.1 RDD family protein [Cryobacterium sp. MDB2-A-1]TFC08850.1 RDD family protein [Cryobacterium sp. MDB2-A-2]TFC18520.1 RDD family protein [Cryobacterium glucosi]TFC19324.1 RDD family protein [Cryobacterium sp. MDB2-10]